MVFRALIALLLCSPLAGFAAERDPGERLGDLFDSRPLIAGQREFLDPEEAFVIEASQRDPAHLRVTWSAADGYYLYRDKFRFTAAEGTASLGAPRLPDGEVEEDPEFGRVEVYYGDGQAVVPVTDVFGDEFVLLVGYQGCAKDGICYPPMTKSFPVVWNPSAGGVPAPGTEAIDGTPVAEQDRVAALIEDRAAWLVAVSFFGFGLLLAFTPCVLPMVPILSGILVGHGRTLNTGRAFRLSLTYVLAMAAVYAAAGVIAGIFGHNLQAVFQKPAVLIAFSGVFVLLALSMFGFYELQLPARWQARLSSAGASQAGSLRGAALMGALSALIVGPCVAPPLAGALIFIGHSGDAVRGGLVLSCMALGMGMPLLLLGTSAGRLLPQAGPWMKTVQAVFGVVLLGVAIWLLSRILPGPLTLALWAILILVSGIYLGALDALMPPVSGWRRLWKGLGVTLLIYGAALLVGAMSGSGDLWRPLSPLTAGRDGSGEHVERLAFRRIDSAADLQQALAAADGRPVMLDFYADWCVECKQMERETFADETVRGLLSDFMLLQADVTEYDRTDRELLAALDLYGPPAILFFDQDASELAALRLVGFVGPQAFREHLHRVRLL